MRRFCIAPTFLSISCPVCLFSELGMAQRKFAHCLGEFQFEYIGDAKTDDEKCIGECGFFFFFNSQSFITMETTTWNLCFWLFNYQKSQSGFFFLHLDRLCVWVRVTDWFSLFGFSFRWVFARVLLIPQKPRRSKGADGKNSQSEPAWIPWKIPLSVREPASLTLHLSLSLNGVVPAVRTLANCNLHHSFINAWLPFCQGILRYFKSHYRQRAWWAAGADRAPSRWMCVSLMPRQASCCTSGSPSQR